MRTLFNELLIQFKQACKEQLKDYMNNAFDKNYFFCDILKDKIHIGDLIDYLEIKIDEETIFDLTVDEAVIKIQDGKINKDNAVTIKIQHLLYGQEFTEDEFTFIPVGCFHLTLKLGELLNEEHIEYLGQEYEFEMA